MSASSPSGSGQASTTPPAKNRLLSLLNDQEFKALEPFLEQVHTSLKQTVYEPGKAISHIYFPCNAVFSVLTTMAEGGVVEVGTIGNEGFTSIEPLLGGTVSNQQVMCQIEGQSLRMMVSDFKDATTGDTPLRRVAQQYLIAYLSQVSQSTACNRLHVIEARFARWVLMTHDRVAGNSFVLTQEFLAEMLGVNRPSVSLVAGAFQNAGLIRYKRGNLAILDRKGMEEIACECYVVVKAMYDRLLGSEAR